MTGIVARDMELSSVTYTSHEPIAEAVTYNDGASGTGRWRTGTRPVSPGKTCDVGNRSFARGESWHSMVSS